MSASQSESSPHWSIRTWLRYLQRGGGPKKRFQYCLDPHFAETILYLRAMQDNALLPSDFAEYIYHVGSSHDTHSIIQSGLIASGEDVKKGKQTAFFTDVNPTFAHLHKHRDQQVYKQNWKIHQNTVYWANLRVAQKKGMTFYQTRCDAIILHNTLPAACMEKVVRRSTVYENIRISSLGAKSCTETGLA